MPEGYHYEWAGEYESLRAETAPPPDHRSRQPGDHRCASLRAFNSARAAMIVMATLPFGLTGGVLSSFLFTDHLQHFSRGRIRFGFGRRHAGEFGVSVRNPARLSDRLRRIAIRAGALLEMRPILLACLAASRRVAAGGDFAWHWFAGTAAAGASGRGSDDYAPLAILFLMPVLASYWLPPAKTPKVDSE